MIDPGSDDQSRRVVHTETVYLDMAGSPVPPDNAVKVITRWYDANGQIVYTSMEMRTGPMIHR